MSANKRIQWLHSRISAGNYPNANHLAAKFGISHRQAQRDVDFLRVKLGAPLKYSPSRFGYYYTEHFSLPIYITSDNDDEYSGFSGKIGGTPSSDSTVIQMQIPYTAEISAGSTEDNPQHHGYRRDHNADKQRVPGAIKNADKDIPAEVIGSK